MRHRPIHFDISGGGNDAVDVSTNSQPQPKDETTVESPPQRFAVDVMTDFFFGSDAEWPLPAAAQPHQHQPQLMAEMTRQPLIQNGAEYETEIEKDRRALQNYKKAAKAAKINEKQDEKDNKVVKSVEIAEPLVEPIAALTEAPHTEVKAFAATTTTDDVLAALRDFRDEVKSSSRQFKDMLSDTYRDPNG